MITHPLQFAGCHPYPFLFALNQYCPFTAIFSIACSINCTRYHLAVSVSSEKYQVKKVFLFYSIPMKQENTTEQDNKKQIFEEKRAAAFEEFLKIHFCQACLDQFAASYSNTQSFMDR